MDAEVYKITAINGDGVAITSYVLPNVARTFRRMMLEEYGNVESEGLAIDDLPEDVRSRLVPADED